MRLENVQLGRTTVMDMPEAMSDHSLLCSRYHQSVTSMDVADVLEVAGPYP